MLVKELLSIRGIHMDRKISRITLKTLAYLLFFITITNPAVISQAQAGELYQWKDKEGNVYLSDTPPDASLHQGEVKSTYAPEEPVAATEREPSATQPPPVRQKEVTIYTNKTWPYCRQAKEFLSRKGVRYQEIDVNANRKEAEEIYRTTGRRAVPVIVIDGEVISGFNPQRIEDKLR